MINLVPNHKKGFALIPLLAIVSTLIVITGLLGWRYFSKNDQPQTSTYTHLPTSIPSQSANLSSDENLRDWKTYTGQIIKVSFKVPKTFTVSEQKGVIQNTLVDGLITVKNENAESMFAIVIAATGTPQKFLYSENTTIDGNNATKSYYCKCIEDFNTESTGPNEPYTVLVRIKGRPMVINYLYSRNNEELMAKILSTFKFLE